MGRKFLLNKQNFNYVEQIEINYILKTPISENEADELLVIQELISNEISEPINLLTKEGLIIESNYQAEGLTYCLSKNANNECIGYGYGYIENENEFYIDTIGVHPEYRRRGIGTKIKIELIINAFEKLNVDFIKAITQDDNTTTIGINERLGFI